MTAKFKCVRCRRNYAFGQKLSGEPYRTCERCRLWSKLKQADIRAEVRELRETVAAYDREHGLNPC